MNCSIGDPETDTDNEKKYSDDLQNEIGSDKEDETEQGKC